MTNFASMNNDKSHLTHILYILLAFSIFSFSQACNSGPAPDELSSEDSTASEAIRQINAELRKDPGNPELYYRKAKAYAIEHNTDDALRAIDKAVEKDSLNPLYRYQKGQLLFDANKTMAASYEFERTIELKPDFYDAYIRLGELYLIVKNHRRSLELFTKAQELDPKDARPYFYKGLNFKDVKDTSNAIISFQRALEIDNNHYKANMQLATLYAAKGDAMALQFYNNALRIDSNGVDALYGRALYLQENNKMDAAVDDYRKIVSINPDDYRAYYNIGFINAFNKNYERAIENFSNAILANPEYIEAYYMRGWCHEMLKHKSDALNNYDYALQLNPEYAKAIEGKKRLK